MERVSDYLIRKINEAGAGCVFMITGRGILYLTDAVARNENIRHICTYHEQGAGYAAMSYAAAKEGVSLCLVSTGCAAANAVTSCLCAYQDNLPVVFISGNNPLEENTRHTGADIRTYGSQEADIIGIVGKITKYAVMLEDKERVAYETEKALHLALSGRKGPVWIDVPLDVQNMRIDENTLVHFEPDAEPEPESCCIRSVADDLNKAERPLILIGGGARGAKAGIAELVGKYGIPLAFSPSACDIYGSGHELSIGAVGSIGGTRAGNFAVQNADFILAIGTKLCSQETGMKHAFARSAKITVVDIDEKEHTKQGVHIDRVITMDADDFVTRLLDTDINAAQPAWTEKCTHWKEIFAPENEEFAADLEKDDISDLYSFARILSDSLADDATVITDAGFEELIIPSAVSYRDGQICLFPASQGAMGYAVPAVIGAWAAGRKNIACVVGDGSFMMNMQELHTAVSLGISAKIFVISNNMYAVIRKRQKDLFRNRTIGNDPSDGVSAPDFEKIAACCGCAYTCIPTLSSLRADIGEILNRDGLELIEVICTPDQKYLHESYAIGENKRLVHRPIEDMAPFLSRDLIAGEMITDMMEE